MDGGPGAVDHLRSYFDSMLPLYMIDHFLQSFILCRTYTYIFAANNYNLTI